MTSSWVQDSIEAGHCLPTDNYRVDKFTGSSTPIKQDQTQLGMSTFDTILIPEESLVTVNSTARLGETCLTWLAGCIVKLLHHSQARSEA